MPNLPPGLATVTLTGRYAYPDGTPMAGSVTLTPTPRVLTSATLGVILLGPSSAILVGGFFQLVVLATDDPDVSPVGWTYRVDEHLAGNDQRAYELALPAAAPLVSLPAVAPTDPAEGDYLVVTGPPGVEFRYEHVQASPASVWQVQHSLGKYPNVSIINDGGRQVWADVDHSTTDLTVITFPTPYSGRAVCS